MNNLLIIYFILSFILGSQDFGIVGYNDDYIITISNNKILNIHSWRQSLSKSIDLNNSLNLLKLKENLVINSNVYIYTEFKDNKATLYLYGDKPRVINMTTD